MLKSLRLGFHKSLPFISIIKQKKLISRGFTHKLRLLVQPIAYFYILENHNHNIEVTQYEPNSFKLYVFANKTVKKLMNWYSKQLIVYKLLAILLKIKRIANKAKLLSDVVFRLPRRLRLLAMTDAHNCHCEPSVILRVWQSITIYVLSSIIKKFY